ncbi:hypothetical protein GCM10010169_51720 [Micromonospora fulviviridis]|nr:hypothetical protein GCM10010169_51720 [Micromonospora fulviviridis]
MTLGRAMTTYWRGGGQLKGPLDGSPPTGRVTPGLPAPGSGRACDGRGQPGHDRHDGPGQPRGPGMCQDSVTAPHEGRRRRRPRGQVGPHAGKPAEWPAPIGHIYAGCLHLGRLTGT